MARGSTTRRENGRWLARYPAPDGRERSKQFDRKTDAQRWLTAEVAKLNRGEWTDPAAGKVTVGEYAAQWFAGKLNLKPSTRESYDSILRLHILTHWGRVPLAGVRHEDVARWVVDLRSGGLSASRTRHAFGILMQILDTAVRSRRIPANTGKGVELPSLPTKADRPDNKLTAEEVWALADEAGDEALSILLLAWCGMRFGELAALRVSDVHLLKREISISRSLSERGGHLIEGTPKTRASIRSVAIAPWLADLLAANMAGRLPNDRLITAPDGGALRNSNWRRRIFDPAVIAAGIATQELGDRFRPHDLRHTCASLHIQAGTPPKVLSEMLGHASVGITLDRYGHLYPGDAQIHVDNLGKKAIEARGLYKRTKKHAGDVNVPDAGKNDGQ